MADVMNFPGTVEWSGENPGISLKEDPNGPFVSVASFFRVMLSPHGRGHALMLMMSPQEANHPADRGNFCFSDNEKLARWLVSDFVSYFGAWKDTPGLTNLVYRPLESAARSGDSRSEYSETVKAGSMTIALTWRQLGKPELGGNLYQTPDPDLAAPVDDVIAPERKQHRLRPDRGGRKYTLRREPWRPISCHVASRAPVPLSS